MTGSVVGLKGLWLCRSRDLGVGHEVSVGLGAMDCVNASNWVYVVVGLERK